MVKLMETLSDWLLSLPLQRIPYQAVLDLVDNKMRVGHTCRTHMFPHTNTEQQLTSCYLYRSQVCSWGRSFGGSVARVAEWGFEVTHVPSGLCFMF